MLTVKHITTDYVEMIYSASVVKFDPMWNRTRASTAPQQVYLIGPDTPDALVGGKVYVMNEQGATVAKYELSSEAMTAAEATDLSGLGTYAAQAKPPLGY